MTPFASLDSSAHAAEESQAPFGTSLPRVLPAGVAGLSPHEVDAPVAGADLSASDGEDGPYQLPLYSCAYIISESPVRAPALNSETSASA